MNITPVEEKTGTIPPHVLRLEDIPGAETEKRALEVALAGGHPIAFVYGNGSQAVDIVHAGKRIAESKENGWPFLGLAYPICPCGNYGHHHAECRCRIPVIQKHMSKLAKRVNDFPLWIESTCPFNPRLMHKGEPEARLIERVRRAKNAPEPTADLDCSSQDLLDAYTRVRHNGLDMVMLTAVAKTIARLDGQNRILVQHLAEALQYQPYGLPGFQEWAIPRPIEASTGMLTKPRKLKRSKPAA